MIMYLRYTVEWCFLFLSSQVSQVSSGYDQFFAGYLRNRADYPGDDKSRLVVNPVAYPCGKPHYLMDIPVYSGGKKAFQRPIL